MRTRLGWMVALTDCRPSESLEGWKIKKIGIPERYRKGGENDERRGGGRKELIFEKALLDLLGSEALSCKINLMLETPGRCNLCV